MILNHCMQLYRFEPLYTLMTLSFLTDKVWTNSENPDQMSSLSCYIICMTMTKYPKVCPLCLNLRVDYSKDIWCPKK